MKRENECEIMNLLACVLISRNLKRLIILLRSAKIFHYRELHSENWLFNSLRETLGGLCHSSVVIY